MTFTPATVIRATSLLLSVLVSSRLPASAAGFTVAPLLTDNMVLQQRSEVPLWGSGIPGTKVRVNASWGELDSTTIAPDSTWQLKVRTPAAGGPFTLTFIHNGPATKLSNVMTGEVWLCSGQSNMEMPLKGSSPSDTILHSAAVIASATDPDLRFFTVRRAFAPTPGSRCQGSWVASSPLTAPAFSAAAYFFGRRLREELQVPVGLIHSSWGGTAIHSWISEKFLSREHQFDSTLNLVHEATKIFDRLNAWLAMFPTLDMKDREGDDRWENLHFEDDTCSSRVLNDSTWHTMEIPALWESGPIGEFDGAVWFRKRVTIPDGWLHNSLVLELGRIDDVDETYVNGVKVGSHEAPGQWNVNRVYGVPASLVDSTELVIAVRVIDYGGGGGIYGNPNVPALHPPSSSYRIALAGKWKYRPVAEYHSNTFSIFGAENDWYAMRPAMNFSAQFPTALYNGMIHPLVPFSIRGVIWYQGESDVTKPQQYGRLFPMLIQNWRTDFQRGDVPFYYVQIAPFNYGAFTHSELLRESQTKTLAVKNTGMAVTLDIGNPDNIHPADKQDVGERLARWALARTYGRDLEYSGPLVASVKNNNGTIELTFDHASGGLELRPDSAGNGFQIAGADHVFHDASVEVRGNILIVSRPDIKKPEAVRYAFGNVSHATLFNKEGLPAPSFRTDSW